MALIARSKGCCGVRELYDLGGPSSAIIRQVHHAINHSYNAAFYWFADRAQGEEGATNEGRTLAAYIVKYKLGMISETGPVDNPQSGHKLVVWLWQIDKNAIDAFVLRYGGQLDSANYLSDGEDNDDFDN